MKIGYACINTSMECRSSRTFRLRTFQSSLRELMYHSDFMDGVQLEPSAKIQIHMGGKYKDKQAGMERFTERCLRLNHRLKKRLVLENDENRYDLRDCLAVSSQTGIPIVFDTLHFSMHNSGEQLKDALMLSGKTWRVEDGPPIVDYSTQEPGRRPGTRAATLNISDFESFLEQSKPFDFDIMLEVKDKEKSALRALSAANGDERLGTAKNFPGKRLRESKQ